MFSHPRGKVFKLTGLLAFSNKGVQVFGVFFTNDGRTDQNNRRFPVSSKFKFVEFVCHRKEETQPKSKVFKLKIYLYSSPNPHLGITNYGRKLDILNTID